MSELSALPDAFAAGNTVVYRKSFADYPANASWAAALHLRGPSILNVAAAASGADFVFTIAATDTAALTPGRYEWVERVTKSGEVHDAAAGFAILTRNLATAIAGDTQTYEEKTLAVIEAALTGELTDNMRSYQIAGRAVALIEPLELEKLRTRYRQIVALQRNPGKFGTDVKMRFTSPV